VEQKKVSKVVYYIKEIAKWGLFVWLIWPITYSMQTRMSFPRMMAGILLFVLYIGKLFYDVFYDTFRHRENKNKYVELLVTVGAVTFVAILVGAIALFIGLYSYEMMKSVTADPSE